MALYRVNIRSSKPSDANARVVSVLHVVTHDDPAWLEIFVPTPQELADEIDTQLTGLYRAMLPNTYTLNDIDVVTVGNPNDPSQVPSGYTKVKNLAGTLLPVDDELPAQVCALIHLKTDRRGRSFRGWQFAPPAEQKDLLNNDLFNDPSNYMNAVNAYAAKLTTSFGGGSTWSTLWNDTWQARFVVYSRTRHRRGETPFHARVVSAQGDRTVHWLRSRGR